MKIQAIECLKCGYIIYSRARHDMRWCHCKSCAIDGGRDYVKVCGSLDDIKEHILDLPLTSVDLYEDWNKDINNFGSISPCGTSISSES